MAKKHPISTMRIEDVCIWRKALAEHPDQTMMILLDGLRLIAKGRGDAAAVAVFTLETAGFGTGLKGHSN